MLFMWRCRGFSFFFSLFFFLNLAASLTNTLQIFITILQPYIFFFPRTDMALKSSARFLKCAVLSCVPRLHSDKWHHMCSLLTCARCRICLRLFYVWAWTAYMHTWPGKMKACVCLFFHVFLSSLNDVCICTHVTMCHVRDYSYIHTFMFLEVFFLLFHMTTSVCVCLG